MIYTGKEIRLDNGGLGYVFLGLLCALLVVETVCVKILD